jgi:hypothetical protein
MYIYLWISIVLSRQNQQAKSSIKVFVCEVDKYVSGCVCMEEKGICASKGEIVSVYSKYVC